MDLALEVRKEALTYLEAEGRSLADDFGGLVAELRSLRKAVGGIVHNPLDSVLPTVILPLAGAILKSLRRPGSAG